MWVDHVWKHYIEFKCLPTLDLQVLTMEADTTLLDSPFQLFMVLLKQNCWHTPDFLHLHVTTVACKTCQAFYLSNKINIYIQYIISVQL